MAERVGFEPTVRCRTAVFKTASLNHSDISPCGHSRYAVSNAYLLYQICAVLSSLYANFSFFCTIAAQQAHLSQPLFEVFLDFLFTETSFCCIIKPT